MIERSVYIEAEAPGTAVLMSSIGYTGAGLEREETLKSSCESDNYQNWRVRYSKDNGRTLAPVEEFRYIDDTSFYSPSSIHRFIRSTRTGALYWIGNICDESPQRNLPRYPLCMCLVNEEEMALERDSLMILDDRGSDDPESIAFSNFLLVEDKETLNIEMYMTRGAAWDVPGWKSSVYRYVISP